MASLLSRTCPLSFSKVHMRLWGWALRETREKGICYHRQGHLENFKRKRMGQKKGCWSVIPIPRRGEMHMSAVRFGLPKSLKATKRNNKQKPLNIQRDRRTPSSLARTYTRNNAPPRTSSWHEKNFSSDKVRHSQHELNYEHERMKKAREKDARMSNGVLYRGSGSVGSDREVLEDERDLRKKANLRREKEKLTRNLSKKDVRAEELGNDGFGDVKSWMHGLGVQPERIAPKELGYGVSPFLDQELFAPGDTNHELFHPSEMVTLVSTSDEIGEENGRLKSSLRKSLPAGPRTEINYPKSALKGKPLVISSSYSQPGGQLSQSEIPLPVGFISPPLLPGLLVGLKNLIGEGAYPTDIQQLSLRWILEGANLEEFPGSPQIQKGNDSVTASGQEYEGLAPNLQDAQHSFGENKKYRQFLLASETGSGKSLAYLLPLVQNLKLSENSRKSILSQQEPKYLVHDKHVHKPRSLILVPTHELSRQIAGFAKQILHAPDVKLRVICVSRTNEKTKVRGRGEDLFLKGQEKKEELEEESERLENNSDASGTDGMEFTISPNPSSKRPVDLLVGTPMRILDMVRGKGWDREERGYSSQIENTVQDKARVRPGLRRGLEEEKDHHQEKERIKRRGRDIPYDVLSSSNVGDQNKKMSYIRHKRGNVSLENVEWVIIDEADVLFDPDFQETTRTLLADISKARGHPVEVLPLKMLEISSYKSNFDEKSGSNRPKITLLSPTGATSKVKALPLSSLPQSFNPLKPLSPPYNLLLTSATIPRSLNAYVSQAYPQMIRLASPRLHSLPRGVRELRVRWSTPGNGGGAGLIQKSVVRKTKNIGSVLGRWIDVGRMVGKVWLDDWRRMKMEGGELRAATNWSVKPNADIDATFNTHPKEPRKFSGWSKILIFVNKTSSAYELGEYLTTQGIRNVVVANAVSRMGKVENLQAMLVKNAKEDEGIWNQKRNEDNVKHQNAENLKGLAKSGSKQLARFLKNSKKSSPSSEANMHIEIPPHPSDDSAEPNVLVTTSLLSRGIDFSDEITHVFLADKPRNRVDFLHRAGRTGRMGGVGTVVVFGSAGQPIQ